MTEYELAMTTYQFWVLVFKGVFVAFLLVMLVIGIRDLRAMRRDLRKMKEGD